MAATIKRTTLTLGAVLATWLAVACGDDLGRMVEDAGASMRDAGSANAQTTVARWEVRESECLDDGTGARFQPIEWPGLTASKVVSVQIFHCDDPGTGCIVASAERAGLAPDVFIPPIGVCVIGTRARIVIAQTL